MDIWPIEKLPLRRETHFGNRDVRCFAERPNDIYEMFLQTIEANPNNEAVVAGNLRLSWRELHVRVLCVASGLQQRHIRAGDRIALLLGNNVEFIISTLAAAVLGAVVVPISVREKMPGIAYVLNQCTASALIFGEAHQDQLPPLDETPKLKLRVVVGADAEAVSFDTLAASAPVDIVAEVSEEDIAAILYTSGTTGKPKGAMLTHFNIIHSGLQYENLMALGATDRQRRGV